MDVVRQDAGDTAAQAGPSTLEAAEANNMASSSAERQIAELEYGHAGLQEMLGDALVELNYLKEKHRLDRQAIQLLQRKTQQVSAEAEVGFQLVKDQKSQEEEDLQRELVTREFQLSESRLEAQQWKRKAALLQLRLASVQEDLTHFRTQHELLRSEYQAEVQHGQATQEQLTQLQQAGADLETKLAAGAAQQTALQGQLSAVQAELGDKTKQLAAAQKQSQDWQSAAAAAECASRDRLLAAQQHGVAVEERARLAEQIAAAAQERANLAEQRLAQRSVAIEERLKAADERSHLSQDLSQERLRAAVEKASMLEEHLREQLSHAREDLQRETQQRATLQAELRAKDKRIRELEDMCKEPAATPGRKVAEAMGLVGALVSNLDGNVPAAEEAAQQPKAKRPRKAATAAADTLAATAATEQAEQEDPQPAKPKRSRAAKAAPARNSKQTSPQAAVVEEGEDMPSQSADAAGDAPGAAQQAKPKAQRQPRKPAAGRQRASKAKQAEAAQPSRSAPCVNAAEQDEGKACSDQQQGRSMPTWANATAADTNRTADTASSPARPRPASQASHCTDANQPGPAACAEAPLHPGLAAAPQPRQRKPLPKSRLGQQGTKRAAEQPAEDPTADAAAAAGGQAHAGNGKRQRKPSVRALAAQAAAVFDSEAEISEDEAGVSDFDDELGPTAKPAAAPAKKDAAKADEATADPTAAQAQAAAKKRKEASRPVGVAKIDLSTVWGQAATPAGGVGAPAAGAPSQAGPAAPPQHAEAGTAAPVEQQDKENAGAQPPQAAISQPAKAEKQSAPAAQVPAVADSRLQKDPLAAINPRVLEAAAARSTAANNLTAKVAIRKSYSAKPEPSGEAPAKRKLLKPSGNGYSGYVDTLPASMLFGDSFKVPKLLKK